MTREEIIDAFSGLAMWARSGVRAPHKPLLVLYAIGQLLQGEDGVGFHDVEKRLTGLLRAFGPPRRTQHPEDPFWRLRNDGVWEVQGRRPRTTAAGGARITDLRRNGNVGRFPEEIQAAFREDPRLGLEVALLLLETHFPHSMHDEILSAVELNVGLVGQPGERVQGSEQRRQRDPAFREQVLVAYEYSCAVCRMDIKLDEKSLALDAAHIKWHAAGGPDIVPNGLALCSLHHRVFDKGGLTVDRDLLIRISERVMGTTGRQEALLRFNRKPLLRPRRVGQVPKCEFLDWHQRNVFRPEPV